MASQQIPEDKVTERYSEIKKNPKYLDVDKDAVFVEALLHNAVSDGHNKLALEILQLMPSQGRKLNHAGYTPLHVALQNRRVDLVRDMIRLDPELIRVAGRERMTPLHYVAQLQYGSSDQEKKMMEKMIDLLAEFLLCCPDSISDLTVRGDTAVHVAVKNKLPMMFKVLHGWIKWKGREEVLELRDWEGKTALELVHDTDQIQEMLSHPNSPRVYFPGFAPPADYFPTFVVYLCDFSTRGRLQGTPPLLKIEKLNRETRNAILVVAVLIATATFQAVLSPPGGFSDHNPITNSNTSTTITSNATIIANDNNEKEFAAFTYVNSLAFSFSLALILMVLPFHPYNTFLYLSVIFFTVTYIMAIQITLPDQNIITTIAVLFPCICFVYGFCSFYLSEADDETYWKRKVGSRNEGQGAAPDGSGNQGQEMT